MSTDSFSFNFAVSSDELETDRMPKNNLRLLRRDAKIATLTAMKRQWCFDHIQEIPPDGSSLHMVTNARFDFWDFVPTLLKMAGCPCLEFYGSTWILNRRNAQELLALFDARQILAIGFITGIYFKRRESATYAFLYEGLAERKQRFKAALNHSKWFSMLLQDGRAITVESSANFTENGNIETHVLTVSRELFDFHKAWSDELLDSK